MGSQHVWSLGERDGHAWRGCLSAGVRVRSSTAGLSHILGLVCITKEIFFFKKSRSLNRFCSEKYIILSCNDDAVCEWNLIDQSLDNECMTRHAQSDTAWCCPIARTWAQRIRYFSHFPHFVTLTPLLLEYTGYP